MNSNSTDKKLNSMTGYGQASTLLANNKVLEIEVKSLNHRFFEFNYKAPKLFSPYELDLRKIVNSFIHRGKVDFMVSYRSSLAPDLYLINEEFLLNSINGYVNTKKKFLNEKYQLSDQELIFFYAQAAPTNDITYINSEDSNVLKEQLVTTSYQALNNLIAFRQTEGKKISQDLSQYLVQIKEQIDQISKVSNDLPAKILAGQKNRLEQILNELELSLDRQQINARLALELAVITDKIDISEEISRLRNHILMAEDKINKSFSPLGKELDFISQEMLREINTIGAKANDTQITNFVVSSKVILEKFKEQVHNLE